MFGIERMFGHGGTEPSLAEVCPTMSKAFYVPFFMGALVLGLSGLAFADTVDTCQSLAPSMLLFQQGVNDSTVAAGKAGRAAQDLPGTRPAHNPGFKVVEDQFVIADDSATKAFRGLGPLASAKMGDVDLQKATDLVTAEGRSELQASMSFSRFALTFERSINTRQILVSRLALAHALQNSSSQTTSTSRTYGNVDGQQFNATTTTTATTTGPRPPLELPPPDASIGERQEALTEHGPEIEMLPYTFNPLVTRWMSACAAAHQPLPALSPNP